MTILTVLAALSAARLRINLRWSDLLPEHDPKVIEFDKVLRDYRSASTTIIVVQGNELLMKQFVESIAPQIEHLTAYVERVDYKIDKEFFAEHGFMLVKSANLERMKGIFEDLNLVPFLTHINDNFEAEYITTEAALTTKEKEDAAVQYLDGLDYWLKTMDWFITQLDEASKTLADSAVERFLYGDPYFISQDKHTILVIVKPTFPVMDVDKCTASTDSIKTILNQAMPNFPGIKAGLTGTVPLARDEMVYGTNDMKGSSLIAILLVVILFIVTFRMWSSPLLAGLNLIIAIILTAGLGSIFVGRLNIMTSMFAVILIGLGIDYSIHIISVFSERRVVDKDSVKAMEQTFVRSGSGIITGALTTAAAFFALVISVTRGIKEMGIILGVGIIVSMVTTLAGLPAFLEVRERIARRIRRRPATPTHVEFTAMGNIGQGIANRPLWFIVIAVLITGFFLFQALGVKFDYNYLNMEPKAIPSVVLQDTIIRSFGLSTDFAMVTAKSIEESWRLAEKAKTMASVSMVENIADYCPPQELQRERKPQVAAIRKYLESNRKEISLTHKLLQFLLTQLERLDMNVYELSQLAFIGGQDKVDAKCQSIIGNPNAANPDNYIKRLVEKIRTNPAQAIHGLNRFQNFYMPVLRTKAYRMANPEIITLNMLPEHIKEQYINDTGDRFLITIYARQKVWDFTFLRQFTKQLESVSPNITGTPLMFLRLVDYIGRDGLRATLLTIVIVFLLLWFDFRRFRLALIGMIPLIIGGIWMVGLLKSLGMMLTFVNVMGIPMIVGIGIDDGVHLLHRYRYEGFNQTKLVLKSTGKAILVTSLTTMVGFGSLMIAKYRGFISLGALLVLGVAACFLTTILILPAIVGFTQKRKK